MLSGMSHNQMLTFHKSSSLEANLFRKVESGKPVVVFFQLSSGFGPAALPLPVPVPAQQSAHLDSRGQPIYRQHKRYPYYG